MDPVASERSSSDRRNGKHAPEWGPVRRGYGVLLPDGRRGLVEDIRLGDDGVELIVATGLSVRSQLTIGEREIEAILPAARRIVVCGSYGVGVDNGVGEVEAAGGILRMPVLHSLRPGSLPQEPA